MAREPHYPEEAAVGTDVEPAAGSKRTKHLVTGAAIGIGSAAIVAALLYANRSRDRKS